MMPMIQKIQFGIGIFLALAGAVILFEGSVFGESNTSTGIAIGVIGIVLIASSKVRPLG